MDVIDLTDDDACAGTVQAANDATEQRRQIMDFAKSVNRGRDLKPPEPKRRRIDPEAPGHATASQRNHHRYEQLMEEPKKEAKLQQLVPITNAELKELHDLRMLRQNQQSSAVVPIGTQPGFQQQPQRQQQHSGTSNSSRGTKVCPGATDKVDQLRVLTYNLWFAEEVALELRLQALGALIEQHDYPDILLFQEVTYNMQHFLSQTPWWSRYEMHCKPLADYFVMQLHLKSRISCQQAVANRPFKNSVMGRCLLFSAVQLGCRASDQLVVATSHLESPLGRHQVMSGERQEQAREALQVLDESSIPDVIFAGDMNWKDKRDGPPPLPPCWRDAWVARHGGGAGGLTYDPHSNAMIGNNYSGSRLDRFWVKLPHWDITGVDMLGTQPLEGVTYWNEKLQKTLPVYLSDHYGLMLTLQRKTM